MEPTTQKCSGADWLAFEPTEKETESLPIGLALRTLQKHPTWDVKSSLGSYSVTEAYHHQNEALSRLFNDLHAMRSPVLGEAPKIFNDDVLMYNEYLDKLVISFAKMSLTGLVDSCSSERLKHVADLEYEYPELIARALTIKLKESEGKLSYNEVEPVSMQFVKDLLFAAKEFGELVHFDFSNSSWDKGALLKLVNGLADEGVKFGSLNLSGVVTEELTFESLGMLTDKFFAILTLPSGSVTEEEKGQLEKKNALVDFV